MHFFKVLRTPHIMLLWTGQVLSAIGDYFYSIAVIWIAVKTSGSNAGFIAGAEAIAGLVFGLLGGVYADRWNRRTTMIAVDLLRAGIVLILPVLALNGLLQFWHLLVVAVLIGSLGALFDPALQASLPALTSDAHALQATNGLMDITRRLARIIGPSLAGLLVAFLPTAHLFTFDSLSFAVSAFSIMALGTHFVWQPQISAEGKQKTGIRGVVQDALDGIHLVSAHRALLWSLIISGISSFIWSVAFVIGVPLLVVHQLGNSIGAYGLIVGAYGVGNVISSLVVGSLDIKHRTFSVFAGKVVLAIGFLLLAFSRSVPLALCASALAAIGGPMGDIMILMMMQSDLPTNQIGKAFSLSMILANVGGSLGYLIAVPLFQLVNVPIGIALGAALLFISSVLGLLRFGIHEPEIAHPEIATVISDKLSLNETSTDESRLPAQKG